MQLRDPKADADRDGRRDGVVDVAGEAVPVAEDGTFSHPAIDRAWAEGYAERNGFDVEAVLVDDGAETCDTVMQSGDVCGRELPCAYHSN